MRAVLKRAGSEAAVFAAYALIAVVLTWPLAIRIPTTVHDHGDPLLTAWILDWTSHALLHQPLRLFDAPIFHPAVMPLAFSEHMAGIALLVLPFHIAGAAPVTLLNVAMLIGFALSAYGAFVLARLIVPGIAAPFAAGMFFGFLPYKFDHLAHLQIISSGWVPLTLAALLVYWRRPSLRAAALVTAALVMNGLTNIYFLLFTAAALAVSLIVLFFAFEKRSARFWLGLAGALVLAALILLPFLLPYRTVSELYELKRWPGDVMAGSGQLSDWLTVPWRSRTYGHLAESRYLHERAAFPGLMALLLAGAALLMTPRTRERLAGTAEGNSRVLRLLDALIVASLALTILAATSEPRFRMQIFERTIVSIRGPELPLLAFLGLSLLRLSLRLPLALGGAENRSLRDAGRDSRFSAGTWVAILWIVLGVLGMLGMRAVFHRILFERITAYESIRAPVRWAVIAYAGMAALVALGAWAILARREGWRRKAAASLLCVAMFADLRTVVQWEQTTTDVPLVYRWVRAERLQPLLEWPIHDWYAFRYVLATAHHRQKVLNGTSGFEPPAHARMREAWQQASFSRSLDLGIANGATILIVHAHWLEEHTRAAVLGTLRAALADGRLMFLRRFDHGVEGDFVFAVRRNLRDAARLRAPETPDGAGQLPAQMLASFLDGKPTYSNRTIGRLESPAYGSHVNGPLRVSGWAISPRGIAEVRVLIGEGRHRFLATRTKRADVTARFPWYFQYDSGFELTIPKRPAGVEERTDVQIEIVDGEGYVTRFEDHLIRWQ